MAQILGPILPRMEMGKLQMNNTHLNNCIQALKITVMIPFLVIGVLMLGLGCICISISEFASKRGTLKETNYFQG